MKRALAIAAVLALTACASPPPRPPPRVIEPPPPPPPPPPPADLCRAREYQSLVGRPRTEIPVPVNPENQRVACTSCPVTLDHNPRRLNFFFDAATGIIREVRCG